LTIKVVVLRKIHFFSTFSHFYQKCSHVFFYSVCMYIGENHGNFWEKSFSKCAFWQNRKQFFPILTKNTNFEKNTDFFRNVPWFSPVYSTTLRHKYSQLHTLRKCTNSTWLQIMGDQNLGAWWQFLTVLVRVHTLSFAIKYSKLN